MRHVVCSHQGAEPTVDAILLGKALQRLMTTAAGQRDEPSMLMERAECVKDTGKRWYGTRTVVTSEDVAVDGGAAVCRGVVDMAGHGEALLQWKSDGGGVGIFRRLIHVQFTACVLHGLDDEMLGVAQRTVEVEDV